jgi:hypothetical protein
VFESFLAREKYADKLRSMMARLEKRFVVSVDGTADDLHIARDLIHG